MDGRTYRIWTMTSRRYLALKELEDGDDVESLGTGTEERSKITFKKKEPPSKKENSFRLMFSEGKYLYADTSNNTVSVQSLTDAAGATDFVPQSFVDSGPFKALKLPGDSTKCIASTSDGHLSLKTFNPFFPHPDTFFLITEA